MSKNITIMEGRTSRSFSGVKKIQTNTAGGGTCDWVPESEAGKYAKLEALSVTENGTFTPGSGNDGFSEVTVNVGGGGGGGATPEPLSVAENGTYTAPEGTAYTPVTVNVLEGGAINGWKDVDATAVGAVSKGDTVYFDTDSAGWVKVEGTGFNSGDFRNAISSDGKKVYSCAAGQIIVYDTTTTPWTASVFSAFNSTYPMMGSGDDGFFIMGNSPKKLYPCDLKTGVIGNPLTLTGSGFSVSRNAFVKDGWLLSDDHDIYTINLSTGATIFRQTGSNYVSRTYWKTATKRYAYNANALSMMTVNPVNGDFSTDSYQVIGSSNIYGNIIGNSDKILIGDTNYQPTWYVSNYDATPWTATRIHDNAPNRLAMKYAEMSADGSLALFPGYNGAAPAVYDMDSNAYTSLTGYSGGAYYNCGIGGDLIVVGNDVWRNMGGGMKVQKASNNLHGSKALGYALENIAAGARGKVRMLFS